MALFLLAASHAYTVSSPIASNSSSSPPSSVCCMCIADGGPGPVACALTCGDEGEKCMKCLGKSDKHWQTECAAPCGCSDPPSPSPPGPSPGPSPPSPTPGGLPVIPDKLWFAWWGAKTGKDDDSYKGPGTDYASVVMDPEPKDKDIDKYGASDTRFLYPAYNILAKCKDDMTGDCDLYDDYKDRWKKAVPKLTQYLKDKKILGFTLGDERVCHGMSLEDWTTMADTMRKDFPRGTAIIFGNECGSTFFKEDLIPKVPDSIDWISVDKYHNKDKDGFVDKLRGLYEQYIYPKLASHQKVGVSPRVGPCKEDQDCPDPDDESKAAEVELDDAKEFVDWQKSDDRIAFMIPYRLDDFVRMKGGNADDLRDYWYDYGKKTK